jgi:hypothetical protein
MHPGNHISRALIYTGDYIQNSLSVSEYGMLIFGGRGGYIWRFTIAYYFIRWAGRNSMGVV